MSALFAPEFVRNARIQLRPGRTLATIVICAVISLSSVAYYTYSFPSRGALDLLEFVISLQIVALVIGGGIYVFSRFIAKKS